MKMKLFKKVTLKTEKAKQVRKLSAAEVAVISGGLNPQPLPPGHVEPDRI
jgi:hypothetical protein